MLTPTVNEQNGKKCRIICLAHREYNINSESHGFSPINSRSFSQFIGNCHEITPVDIKNEKLIHSRKDSVFFQSLSQAFQRAQIELKSSIEIRQFTSACELVSNGFGASVLSELDAFKYSDKGLEYRPFVPKIPSRLTLLRPVLKRPSLVALEFMQMFKESLEQFRKNNQNTI